MFIAIYTKTDGETRTLGRFEKMKAAADAIAADMVRMISRLQVEGGEPVTMWERREVWLSADEIGAVGCVWNILYA